MTAEPAPGAFSLLRSPDDAAGPDREQDSDLKIEYNLIL